METLQKRIESLSEHIMVLYDLSHKELTPKQIALLEIEVSNIETAVDGKSILNITESQ